MIGDAMDTDVRSGLEAGLQNDLGAVRHLRRRHAERFPYARRR